MKKINQFNGDFSKMAEVVSKKAMFDLDRRVVQGTPVDTGVAKGSWQPSNGRAARAVGAIKRFFGIGKTGAFGKSDTQGGATVSAAIQKHRQAKSGQIMWLTSNLSYILPLERGHSKTQAPIGWVARAVRATKRDMARAVRALNR